MLVVQRCSRRSRFTFCSTEHTIWSILVHLQTITLKGMCDQLSYTACLCFNVILKLCCVVHAVNPSIQSYVGLMCMVTDKPLAGTLGGLSLSHVAYPGKQHS